jgi:hypothetical protein
VTAPRCWPARRPWTLDVAGERAGAGQVEYAPGQAGLSQELGVSLADVSGLRAGCPESLGGGVTAYYPQGPGLSEGLPVSGVPVTGDDGALRLAGRDAVGPACEPAAVRAGFCGLSAGES